jgi:hypothetical protein
MNIRHAIIPWYHCIKLPQSSQALAQDTVDHRKKHTAAKANNSSNCSRNLIVAEDYISGYMLIHLY